jgi:hypothetical protein
MKVFQRENWRRSIRVPRWIRHPEAEKREAPTNDTTLTPGA